MDDNATQEGIYCTTARFNLGIFIQCENSASDAILAYFANKSAYLLSSNTCPVINAGAICVNIH